MKDVLDDYEKDIEDNFEFQESIKDIQLLRKLKQTAIKYQKLK